MVAETDQRLQAVYRAYKDSEARVDAHQQRVKDWYGSLNQMPGALALGVQLFGVGYPRPVRERTGNFQVTEAIKQLPGVYPLRVFGGYDRWSRASFHFGFNYQIGEDQFMVDYFSEVITIQKSGDNQVEVRGSDQRPVIHIPEGYKVVITSDTQWRFPNNHGYALLQLNPTDEPVSLTTGKDLLYEIDWAENLEQAKTYTKVHTLE